MRTILEALSFVEDFLEGHRTTLNRESKFHIYTDIHRSDCLTFTDPAYDERYLWKGNKNEWTPFSLITQYEDDLRGRAAFRPIATLLYNLSAYLIVLFLEQTLPNKNTQNRPFMPLFLETHETFSRKISSLFRTSPLPHFSSPALTNYLLSLMY